MKRRSFLELMGGGLLATSFPFTAEDSLITALTLVNDSRIRDLFDRQETSSLSLWDGGIKDQFGIHTAGGTGGFINTVTAAVTNPESRYYGSIEALDRMLHAVKCLLRNQHSDGTIDLHTTNFHSPPDTAFLVEPLTASWTLLDRNIEKEASQLFEPLKTFLIRAGEALKVGGVHTPNHRWVVCGALARLHNLFPDQDYVGRIDEWLAEGIDIDTDGQFTERSTSIYSPTCDRVLMTVSRILNREELLEPVRKNLDMTLYLINPNGEIETSISRRQDQFIRGSLRRFHLPYRYMALRDNNSKYAAATRLIERAGLSRLTGDLIYLLEDPAFRKPFPESVDLPSSYNRHFTNSDLVRIRDHSVSASIRGKQSSFLTIYKDDAVLESVRFATAFFGKGQFSSDELVKSETGITLSQNLEGPYFQPVPSRNRKNDVTWIPNDSGLRRLSEIQELNSLVQIRKSEATFSVEFNITGTDRVPLAIELGFRHGGILTGVEPVSGIDNAFFLAEKNGEYLSQFGNRISFSPGIRQHNWTQLRGAHPKLDALSVYLTGFTPFRYTLEIALK